MGIKNYAPPFPYFGGKSTVADVVWDALGDVDNYIEPFFGSGAVLFLRPGEIHGLETVNDADGMVSNFWRAVKDAPDAVAEHADWIVSEADLHARHLWLVGQRESLTERLCGDPEFYDVKAAGWWVWGLCCWIGNGFCSGNGPWVSKDGVMVLSDGKGVSRQLPHLGNAGQGVNRQRPHLGNSGQGVNRKRPHLGDSGQGVNRRLPHLGDSGQRVNRKFDGDCSARREVLISYMQSLADRLRSVRVCCGDWSRVCGPSVTFKHGTTGVFLDPPYSAEANRAMNIYTTDSGDVAHAAREWAIEQGSNPLMRICLAGYEGEHAMPSDWRAYEWKASGGYGTQGDGRGRENSHRERLWFSPHCAIKQLGLFDISEHRNPHVNHRSKGPWKRQDFMRRAQGKASKRNIRSGDNP